MIELKNVSLSFGEKQVLRGFSMRFEPGKHYALFGPSGCGKTTLLRVIAGLQKPDSGEVIRDPAMRMAFCFQEDRLLPWYTIRQNVALALPPLPLQKAKDSKGRAQRTLAGQWGGAPFSASQLDQAQLWLDRVGLSGEGDVFPAELSGGMKRRASLARALAFDAPVMLMDEPFRALDEAAHADMLRLVRSLAQGKTLILVTHDIRDTEGMEVIRV